MKSILRSLVLLSVVLLVTSGLIHAQTPAETFCGDLTTADCTLLTESQAAMKDLESQSFKLDMNFDMKGLPSKPSEMSFKLTGSGSVLKDSKAMSDLGKIDPTTFGKDPKAIFDLLSKAVTAISADVHFTLDLPADLVKEMGNSTLPKTINLSIKLVDGVGYVNVGELSTAFPQLKGAKGWMGMSIPDLITAIMKQPGFNASMSSMGSGMSLNMYTNSAFTDPKMLAKFMKIERLSDGEVGSTKVAVFKTTLDYAALFALPEMQDMIKQQMQASGSKFSDKDFSAAMLMVRGLMQDAEFNMTQNIGLEDQYLYQTSMNMKFDMSSMKAQMGGAYVFTMGATVTMSDFNDVPAITAPEGALVLPVESVIPSKK